MSAESPELVSGRYVVEGRVGRGGMAVVYQALDRVTGRRVALKQLQPRDDQGRAERSRELFEREFHTLDQLAHPRIVAAHDYGVDGDRPYYTMELLDGGDLFERAPLPWREACALARDVCSALALVHSRRMVFRDLSPRNVRCTSDGKAKLIDFGALAPMGPSQVAVCTPMVAAPEVVHRQPLDGRSDLYALGATLYYTLTGRSPYPARSFGQLLVLWGSPLDPPSRWVPDIPEALDALVLDLLQLEPGLRPASAVEVGQRLEAIGGLDADEHLQISQAYLTTPTMVGRGSEQMVVGRTLQRLQRAGSGAAVLVRGAPGTGRSRFLDSCVLSAKLAGISVVRVTRADAPSGPSAVARVILAQLRDALPEIAHTTPEPEDSAAVRAFICAAVAERPLVITIDDVERFDGDSRSLVALLAHESRQRPLVLLAAGDSSAKVDSEAARMLADASTPMILRPLDASATRGLLASIFGDVPNLEVLVRRMHALALGNPQALMRLAQHLLDRGIIRYAGGAWILPDRIDDGDLPATMAQAFFATVAGLDDDARALARAMAQCPDQRFALDECIGLSVHGDAARVFRSLDRLLAAEVIVTAGGGYALASQAWVEPLAEQMDRELERRLARTFRRRGDGLRAARHLFRIGAVDEALDILVPHAEESHRRTSASSEEYVRFLSTLPHDWLEIYELALRMCGERGRPRRDVFKLHNRLGSILSQNSVCSNGMQAALGRALARDAGLDLYASLDPALPPAERMMQALGIAAERYAATPEGERLFDPKSAIAQLARTTISVIGNFSRTLDLEEWRQMPSLTPLVPLSPVVRVVDSLARGFEARVSGRFEDACAIYRETLDGIVGPDGAGLDVTFVEAIRAALASIVGTLEAVLGLSSAARWADEVAGWPLYQGSALAIRLLERLWQGDVGGADRLTREWEVWRLEQPREQVSDLVTVLWTLQAHAASDDLTRTRYCLEALERTADHVSTWEPMALWARGEYQRIRGDLDAASAALDAALDALPAGRHQIWPCVAYGKLRVLCEQERFAEARKLGESFLEAAQAAGLGYVVGYIRMPLALALARLGEEDEARQQAARAVDAFAAAGAVGLCTGLAHETAARVAFYVGDTEAFERHADACQASFLAHPNAALAAKHQRLLRLTRRTAEGAGDIDARVAPSTVARSQIETALGSCASPAERLQRALELVVATTGARGGYLYGVVEGAAKLCARTEEHEPPEEIHVNAMRYLARELADDAASTGGDATDESVEGEWTQRDGACYRPMVLNHRGARGFMISGLVVLAFDCTQVLRPGAEVATHVSRFIVESGDLNAQLIAR